MCGQYFFGMLGQVHVLERKLAKKTACQNKRNQLVKTLRHPLNFKGCKKTVGFLLKVFISAGIRFSTNEVVGRW